MVYMCMYELTVPGTNVTMHYEMVRMGDLLFVLLQRLLLEILCTSNRTKMHLLYNEYRNSTIDRIPFYTSLSF
jgi:hypothetical protein